MGGSSGILDVLRDSEVVFSDAYCYKPSRLIKVPTDAPVQSMSIDITPASGVFTFPESSPFADRFIIWRSIGQNLFLEERSLKAAVRESCLCFTFTRSAVIAGTSFAVFDNVISLVVPTQSSVHRFFSHLVYDPIAHDLTKPDVRSVLSQFDSQEHLREFHESHLVVTQGHPLRASIAQRMGDTKVTYAMYEGTLVHIHMPADSSTSDCEETVLRESNLFRRLLGGSISDQTGVMDICSLNLVDKRGREPYFYAIYRNHLLRTWNGETRALIHVTEVNPDSKDELVDSEVSNMIVRCFPDGKNTMVIVGISTNLQTKFTMLRDTGTKLDLVTEVSLTETCPLLDLALWRSTDGSTWRLSALWNDYSGGTSADYKLQHTSLHLDESSTGLRTDRDPTWRTVQVLPSRGGAPIMSDSLEELSRSVFNRDNHMYEVVSRAVQIVCQGRQFEVSNNDDWEKVKNFVDGFLRTPEFDAKYGKNGVLTHEEATIAFMHKLSQTCSELEGASRGALSLLNIDFPYTRLIGVIQKNRISCVCESSTALITSLENEGFPINGKAFTNLTDVIESAVEWSVEDECAGEDEAVSLPHVTLPTDMRKWIRVLTKIAESLYEHREGFTSVPEDTTAFGGGFTAGLISSFLKRRIRAAQATAHNIAQFCRLANEMPKSYSREESIRSLVSTLADTVTMLSQKYRLLNDQLSVQFVMDDAHISICSWLTSWNGISTILMEGREKEHDHMDSSGDKETAQRPFNSFIEKSVEAALRCLSPSNPSMTLCKMLTAQRRYFALKRVLDLCKAQSASAAYQFFQGVCYSGRNQPVKTIACFRACLPAARLGDQHLSGALAESGTSMEKSKLLGAFYLQAIRTLSEHGHGDQVIELSKGAIEDLKNDKTNETILKRVHITLFTQEADRGEWKNALQAIHICQDPESRILTLRELLSRLLALKEWKHISELNFGDMAEQVTSILHARAMNESASTMPNTYELLASYHVARENYFKAATAMYEWALRLQDEAQSADLLKRRRDALAAAATFVDLIGVDNYIYFHDQIDIIRSELDEDISTSRDDDMDDEIPIPPRKHQKIVHIVDSKTMSKEWALANARCSLLEKIDIPPVDAQSVLTTLIDVKKYDHAFSFANLNSLPTCSVISAVVKDAILVDCAAGSQVPEWVRENQEYVSKAGGSGNHWDVVRGLLDACLRVNLADSRPLNSVLSTILSHGFPVPCWLESQYMEVDLGGYLRCLIDYEAIQAALSALVKYVEPLQAEIRSVEGRVLLPYAAIDEILKLAAQNDDQQTKALLASFVEKLKSLQKRMQGFSNAAKFSVAF